MALMVRVWVFLRPTIRSTYSESKAEQARAPPFPVHTFITFADQAVVVTERLVVA